jgi:hypothetical protein
LNVSIEYIVSVLIIGLMLSFSITSISSAVNVNLQPVKEEQLQTVAKRFFDKLLLSQGPSNWGSDPLRVSAEELDDIGLADNSGNYYSLDVNKVMRLSQYSSGGLIENPFYIPVERIGQLTGLYKNGHWEYGFRLYMRTALNIEVKILRNNSKYPDIPEVFKFTVTTYNGKRAANALVTASYYCFQMIQGIGQTYTYNFTSYFTLNNVTNFEGWTIMDFSGKYVPEKGQNVESFPFLIVTAKYYGLQSQTVLTFNQLKTLDLLLVGKYLIASFNENLNIAKSAHHLGAHADITVLEVTSDLTLFENPAINVTSTGEAGKIINQGGKNYRVYELEQLPPSNIFVAGIFVESRGREWFAFATMPIIPLSFDIQSSTVPGGIKTETLSRIVTLGMNSYYVELTLWRMAE